MNVAIFRRLVSHEELKRVQVVGKRQVEGWLRVRVSTSSDRDIAKKVLSKALPFRGCDSHSVYCSISPLCGSINFAVTQKDIHFGDEKNYLLEVYFVVAAKVSRQVEKKSRSLHMKLIWNCIKKEGESKEDINALFAPYFV